MTEPLPELIDYNDPNIEAELPELIVPKVELAQFPFDIAVIIDGVVFQIMNVDGQTAAQFMAQPKFVRITKDNSVKVGWKYIDGKFVAPSPEEIAGR